MFNNRLKIIIQIMLIMEYENIIIGGGPAGLQCAYFFTKYNINYILLERSNKCGSFFEQYPHSGKLISVNKKNTGSDNLEFNLRHDWNSLLNDEGLLFTDYSDDFYPNKDKLVDYLNDFANKFKLNIQYNSNVIMVKKDTSGYKLFIENAVFMSCKKLIIATGISKPIIPNFVLNVKDKIKHYGEYPKNYFLDKTNLLEFKNKRVLLFGGGNAALELANMLNEITSHILIASRNKKNWAMSSHYSGDVRSIYLPIIDTFLLKSLNAMDYLPELNDKRNNLLIYQNPNNNKYEIKYSNDKVDLFNKQFDKIIYCTGWTFDSSIFDFGINIVNNLPNIKENCESTNNVNLFFIGSLMQSFDYKRSSGAFIHGFRYLIETFVKINYNIEYENKKFLLETDEHLSTLVEYISERLNTSSHLYQMFSFLIDIVFYNANTKTILYYKNIPLIHIHYFANIAKDIFKTTDFVVYTISLDFGHKHVENYKEFGNNSSGIGFEANSNLIHPVIRIFDPFTNKLIEMYHLHEELFAEFYEKELYYERLKRIFRPILV